MTTGLNSATLTINVGNYSGIVDPTLIYTNSSNTVTSNINFSYILKRCRNCNHAHAVSGEGGCYDIIQGAIAFVICQCKENVPTDNLEYLEYLLKKKESL